jgi:TRAP-type C4-dicarboxylate transport system substrate-binding protein
MTQGLTQFGDDLMERSGGRVHVTYSYSTALGTIPEYYDLVVQGVADVSFAPVFMAQGLFPIGELTTLPFCISTSEIGTQAMFKLYKQGLLDANYDKGVKTLFVSTGESNAIFHVSKPIN